MKEIRIRRLSLENFKCHDRLVLDMEGANVRVFGDNATGKTSIYDGLTWLLFGKDSAGNGEKALEVKPLDESGALAREDCITAVEAVLTVDGGERQFRKECRQLWKSRNGVRICEGNAYAYFADGVPMKKNAYDLKIRELLPEEVFRLLTSVTYFPWEMKWQDRRAVLFEMAGSLSDRALMEREPRFLPLARDMGPRDLSEYRAMLLNRKKGLTGVRDQTPARLSECRRTLDSLGNPDTAALERQLQQLEAQSSPERELEALEGENRRWQQDRARLEDRLQGLRRELDGLVREQAAANQAAARAEQDLQVCREQWMEESSRHFEGDRCPTCGQSLPFERLTDAARSFEAQKQRNLRILEERAQLLGREVQRSRDRLGALAERIPRKEQELRDTEAQLGQQELPGFRQRREELLAALGRDPGELARQKEAIRRELAKAALLESTKERIHSLQEQLDRTAMELEQVESMLALGEEFVRYKARFAEESVNQLFRMARFRLFRECANGQLEERCDATYRGVPYLGLNRGARVNMGIDIINTLSRFYGVRVPLFIDNAESVTRLEPCHSQTIRLVVCPGEKKVRMETE